MRFVILLSLFFSMNGMAFTLNNNIGAAFDDPKIPVNVDSAGCANLALTAKELLDLATEASRLFWNTVPTSNLDLQTGSLQTTDAVFRTGLICNAGTNCDPNPALSVGAGILIACNSNAANFNNSPSVLGVTVPNNIQGDKIVGSLVLVNDNAANSFTARSRAEQISIIAHELGHAVGLGHSPTNDNLMHFQSISTRSDLGADDQDGASFLYPAQQPIDGGCGSIAFVDSTSGRGPGQKLPWWSSFAFGLLVALSLAKGAARKLRPRL